MRTEIIPAVLEKTFPDVTRRLEQVAGLVETVQIDICDGVFVPSVTWPYMAPLVADGPSHYDVAFKEIIDGAGEVNMPNWEDFNFELDLMVADAKKLLPDLLTLGPSRVLFHAEAFNDLYSEMHELAKTVPPLVEVGVAINADTNPEVLYKLLDEKIITSVQCMGIAKIGYQGQPFDERVLTNLKTLRTKYPTLPLGVDGSVTLETAPRLVEAGANRLASGSGIFAAPDIAQRISEFKNILH
jgi:ribulose-phosphate 3-epimerase